jgi:N-methylhydantoinase A/oxoprolinase/acetone carboxylase beta subunit
VAGQLAAYDTNYYERHKLKAGSTIPGPAILFQKDTTTVVPPNWTARVESTGNLILTIVEGADNHGHA